MLCLRACVFAQFPRTRWLMVACEKTFREFVLNDPGMLDDEERLRNRRALVSNWAVADGIYQRLVKTLEGCRGQIVGAN